eukprot:1158748-Pelagomonas_calceolata.AAC.11
MAWHTTTMRCPLSATWPAKPGAASSAQPRQGHAARCVPGTSNTPLQCVAVEQCCCVLDNMQCNATLVLSCLQVYCDRSHQGRGYFDDGLISMNVVVHTEWHFLGLQCQLHALWCQGQVHRKDYAGCLDPPACPGVCILLADGNRGRAFLALRGLSSSQLPWTEGASFHERITCVACLTTM